MDFYKEIKMIIGHNNTAINTINLILSIVYCLFLIISIIMNHFNTVLLLAILLIKDIIFNKSFNMSKQKNEL